ncbi:MAG: hypothetical protein HC821_05405 [Lewinella sp.]|nr:hypothetical protein [Lewinella sp.]
MQEYLAHYQETNEEPALPWLSPWLHKTRVDPTAYQELITSPSPQDTTYQQLAAAIGIAPDHLLLWSNRSPIAPLKPDQWWTYYRINRYHAFFQPIERDTPPPIARLERPHHYHLPLKAVGRPITAQPKAVDPIKPSKIKKNS